MLIGLAGEAGAGKDSFGTILKHKHNFTLLALAYPIKEMICGLLRVPMSMWDDRVWRETMIPLYKKSPRQLAQTIGTEWGRICVHEDMWLERLLEEAAEVTGHTAITDIRFDNEALRIQQLGGHIVKVTRPDSGLGVSHASERGLSDHMIGVYTVNNCGTLDDLANSVKTILTDIQR